MTTLGSYKLLRRLGAGGMGEVWIGRRAALGGASKLVAIKTLLPSKASDANARKMFLDEARLSMLLTNSNIVQVFDVAEDPAGTCYMAMELVDGIDLAQLTEKLQTASEKLSHSAIAYIIGEVLKGLAYAHEFNHQGTRRTIVHRDISPHNVMLSVSGEVKIMDFGVARLASEETSGTFVKGKLRYMPPEQLEGKTRAPTIDLFAVGAILHELLDRKSFRGGSLDEAQLIGMVVRGEVPALTCPASEVPVEFKRLRGGLLAPSPEQRIPSARVAHHMLSQWPGDRDARFELEEIVQRFVTPATNTVPLEVCESSPALDAMPTEEAPTRLLTAVLPDEGSVTGVSGARASEQTGESGETGGSATLVGSSGRPARMEFSRFKLAAIVCLTLASGVMGTSVSVGRWLSEEPAVVAAAEPEPEPAPEPAVTPDPAVASEPESVPAPSIVEPEPEPPAPAPVVVKSQPTKPKVVQTPRVAVTIAAPGVWAQVKVAGKSYTLDRLKGRKTVSARLPPGEQAVAYRDDAEASWQPAGKVTIPKSGPAKLEISPDGKARIVH